MSLCAFTASDSNLKVMHMNSMHCMGITEQKKKTTAEIQLMPIP